MYNIEQRAIEPVGGAARFATAAARYAGESPLVLFSGDCLNPSLMSAFTRGEQVGGCCCCRCCWLAAVAAAGLLLCGRCRCRRPAAASSRAALSTLGLLPPYCSPHHPQMVHVLNGLGVHAAAVGNHDCQ